VHERTEAGFSDQPAVADDRLAAEERCARPAVHHDEYWLFVNPVVLGGGTPYIPVVEQRIKPRADRDANARLACRLRTL